MNQIQKKRETLAGVTHILVLGLLILALGCSGMKPRTSALDTDPPESGGFDQKITREEKQKLTYRKKSYRETLQKSPDSLEALMGLVRVHIKLEEYRQAIQTCNRILKIYPKEHDARLLRGKSHYKLKHYDRAREDLLKVTEEVPRYADAWFLLGHVYMKTTNYRKAREAFSRMIELQPDKKRPYLARARAHVKLNDRPAAKKDLERARQNGARETSIANLQEQVDPDPPLDKSESNYRWRVRSGFTWVDQHANNRADWRTWNESIRRYLDRGAVGLELIRGERFSTWDSAVAVHGYYDLWENAYGWARFQWADQPDFLPRTETTLELTQGFQESWEIRGRYQNRNFPSEAINSYGTGLGYYWRNWYFTVDGLLMTTGGNSSLLGTISARHYFNHENYVQGRFFGGREVVTESDDRIVPDETLRGGSLKYHRFVTERWGFEWEIQMTDYEDINDRLGIDLGIMYRW